MTLVQISLPRSVQFFTSFSVFFFFSDSMLALEKKKLIFFFFFTLMLKTELRKPYRIMLVIVFKCSCLV